MRNLILLLFILSTLSLMDGASVAAPTTTAEIAEYALVSSPDLNINGPFLNATDEDLKAFANKNGLATVRRNHVAVLYKLRPSWLSVSEAENRVTLHSIFASLLSETAGVDGNQLGTAGGIALTALNRSQVDLIFRLFAYRMRKETGDQERLRKLLQQPDARFQLALFPGFLAYKDKILAEAKGFGGKGSFSISVPKKPISDENVPYRHAGLPSLIVPRYIADGQAKVGEIDLDATQGMSFGDVVEKMRNSGLPVIGFDESFQKFKFYSNVKRWKPDDLLYCLCVGAGCELRNVGNTLYLGRSGAHVFILGTVGYEASDADMNKINGIVENRLTIPQQVPFSLNSFLYSKLYASRELTGDQSRFYREVMKFADYDEMKTVIFAYVCVSSGQKGEDDLAASSLYLPLDTLFFQHNDKNSRSALSAKVERDYGASLTW